MPGYTVFAAGVSDSQSNDYDAFQIEEQRLRRHMMDGPVIYFSTCSATVTPYVEHKLRMASVVRTDPDSFVIHLPPVVPHVYDPTRRSLPNFIVDSIVKGNANVRHVMRSVIAADHVARITEQLVYDHSDARALRTVHIAPRARWDVSSLIRKVARAVNRPCDITSIACPDDIFLTHLHPTIDEIAQGLGIRLDDKNYSIRVLEDYVRSVIR